MIEYGTDFTLAAGNKTTPLIEFVRRCDPDMLDSDVAFLHEMNLLPSTINAKDSLQRTALHWACVYVDCCFGECH